MVETAGGLLAAGAHKEVHRALSYLQKTQQADGHWPQNMWLDGSAYWNGIQMDETALPILLMNLAHRERVLVQKDLIRLWPMVKKAVGYLVRNGPVSPQDRWEEDPGYAPFTVAAQVAALLAAADFADVNHESLIAEYLREIADVWHDSIDRWMYVSKTDWCGKFGVEGYYVRIAPNEAEDGISRFNSRVHVKNVLAAEDTRRASHLVSPDALDLVRFGFARLTIHACAIRQSSLTPCSRRKPRRVPSGTATTTMAMASIRMERLSTERELAEVGPC